MSSSREKESPTTSSSTDKNDVDNDVNGSSGKNELPTLSRCGATKGPMERPPGVRALRRSSKVTRSRNSSIQRFVLPSEQSQIPFEPSRTSTVSLATYLHMEDPRRYPRKDTTVIDRMIKRLFYRCSASKSPWIHSKTNRSLIGIPIMRPDSLVVHAWTLVITIVDLTYTAFLVPLSIAFDTTKQGTTLTWLTITDIVGTSFYMVDMLMEFHTGFVAAYDIRRQLVMKRGFVAENYIRRGAFVVDVICVLYVIVVVVDLVVRVLVVLDARRPA